MNTKQFDTLISYIDHAIDVKVEEAFGRDSLTETMVLHETYDELKELLVEEEGLDMQ